MGRPLSILYFLTSVTTFLTGSAFFNDLYGAIGESARSRVHVPASFAILSFSAPALFLLASALSFWSKKESNRAGWIAAVGVLIMLAPLIRHQQGWKLFIETSGPLISAIFILDSLVRRAATIAIVAVGVCAITQGDGLLFAVERYWSFGGSLWTLLTRITPLFLLTTSLVGAISSLIATRKKAVEQADS